MEFAKELERALSGKYRKRIWRPFMSAIKEYRLVEVGDRIAVCISGGKDSMLLAKCMQELKRHSPLDFELIFLAMDPGYDPLTRQKIEDCCALTGIPVQFFETDIFAAIDAMDCSPCYMCAKMRRGYLYRRAREMGCNKIALGHHYDDAVETALMSMIYAGSIQGMLPRLKSDSVEGMELIRPLYKLREQEIIAWRDENGLEFPACNCPTARNARLHGESASDSKRMEMKALIRHLNALNPDADKNIFRSLHNVNLDAVIGWKKNGKMHFYLDE